jgi:hypothetical protein
MGRLTRMVTSLVRGRDVRVGDVIPFRGRCYTVTHFEPHPGIHICGELRTARVARAGSCGLTVFDGEEIEVVVAH